jgi:hypothetical protein
MHERVARLMRVVGACVAAATGLAGLNVLQLMLQSLGVSASGVHEHHAAGGVAHDLVLTVLLPALLALLLWWAGSVYRQWLDKAPVAFDQSRLFGILFVILGAYGTFAYAVSLSTELARGATYSTKALEALAVLAHAVMLWASLVILQRRTAARDAFPASRTSQGHGSRARDEGKQPPVGGTP